MKNIILAFVLSLVTLFSFSQAPVTTESVKKQVVAHATTTTDKILDGTRTDVRDAIGGLHSDVTTAISSVYSDAKTVSSSA